MLLRHVIRSLLVYDECMTNIRFTEIDVNDVVSIVAQLVCVKLFCFFRFRSKRRSNDNFRVFALK